MRICTNCGHSLNDGETVCSVCNSDLITETDSAAEGSITPSEDVPVLPDDEMRVPLFSSDYAVKLELYQAEPEEIPEAAEAASEAEPSEDAEVSLDASAAGTAAEVTPETTAPLFSFTTTSIDLDLVTDQPESETITDAAEPAAEERPEAESEPVSPSDVTAVQESGSENENYKVVKVKVRNDEKLKSVNKERVAVVVIALLALVSVISAVFMIVVPLIRARRQDEAAREQAYMDYLNGEWLSETFIYSGEEFPSCEVLTIGKDSSFISEIWTSPNDRETYDPETWTVTARQSGDLALELATSSLRVSYTDSDGNVMVYRRYILKLDSSSLILREYYNEKMTDYYDVVFTRKGNI